jgi:hypothetical protein
MTVEEVRCQRRRCGRLYSEHTGAGGPCQATGCIGFRWVDPGGQPVGSYADPPADRQAGQASSPRSGEGTSPAG